MAVGGALFGNSGSRATGPKALVEFRAGKMSLNTSTKLVTPDKRKGLVSVIQSDDQLMHFQWKDRGTGTTEDDLIIFPDDVEFKAVPACTTGRVFVLKFKTSSKRMFFWMQEPKTDKDEEFCKKVNENLNNPPAPGSRPSGGSGSGTGSGLPQGLDNLDDSQLQNLINNMSQPQLMQLFGGSLGGGNMSNLASLLGGAGAGSGRTRQAAGTGNRSRQSGAQEALPASAARPETPATSTAAAATPAAATPTPAAAAAASATAATPAVSSAAGIKLSDLQSILSAMPVTPGAAGAAGGSGGPPVDLATSFTGEALQPLLSNPEFLDKVKGFLPEAEKEEGKEVNASDLKGTVQSPQFQQALSMFCIALQSGQLAPLVREFGLNDEAVAAAAQGDMDAFVKGLQKQEGGEKEDKDKPEDMALD